MTNLNYNADSGTNGNTVTITDTASGDHLDVVQPGTGGTVQWSNTHPAHGPLGITFLTGATSTSTYVAWTTQLGSLTQIWGRAYFYLPTVPPTVTQVIARGLGATAQKFRLFVNTSGKLVLADSATVSAGTTTSTMLANTQQRVEFMVTSGTSAAFELRYFASAESDTPTETLTGSTTNFGTANFDEIRFGTGANFANVTAYFLDDLNVNSVGFPGPVQLWTPQPRVFQVPALYLPKLTPIVVRSSLADVVTAAATPAPVVVSPASPLIVPLRPATVRNTLQDPPVLTTPAPVVVSPSSPVARTFSPVVARSSIQDFSTPVTPPPVVVGQRQPAAIIPASAFIGRSSFAAVAPGTQPVVVTPTIVQLVQLTRPVVVQAPPQQPLVPQPPTQPVVVSATAPYRGIPARASVFAGSPIAAPAVPGSMTSSTSAAGFASSTDRASLASGASAASVTGVAESAGLTSTTRSGRMVSGP